MSVNAVEQIVDSIGKLSVFDLAELQKKLEERFNVSAAAMTAGVAAPAQGESAGASAAAAKSEEKAEYKVEILDGGDNKIKVIKALKLIRKDLGLTEAKKMVDEAPAVIAEGVPVADAKKMKEELEAAGAKVKLS